MFDTRKIKCCSNTEGLNLGFSKENERVMQHAHYLQTMYRKMIVSLSPYCY